ncbi:hypothetical protein F66182_8139 [Fusarium sp. NRRL 66182]|nr:hypothetical protein F66182_8139 [Fusarium sp. NRRL 66182]
MATDKLATAFQSKRLVYRAPENNEEDRELFTGLQNDPVIGALSDLAVLRPKSANKSEDLIEQIQKATLPVIICLSPEEARNQGIETSEPVSIGYLVLGWGGRPQGREHHRDTGIGLVIAAAHQDKGYGGEAIDWVLDWAFRFGGFHRVSIGTVSYNERAQHLYKKLGFAEEGRSRQAFWFDRKWYDIVNYSMLEHEWEALRGLG